MKPLSFNLKDAKKISSDSHSSTFQVRGGHQIRVAHSGLRPEHVQALQKLPVHKAEGGEIPKEMIPSKDFYKQMPQGNVPYAPAQPEVPLVPSDLIPSTADAARWLATPAGGNPSTDSLLSQSPPSAPDIQSTAPGIQAASPQPAGGTPAMPQFKSDLESGYQQGLQGLKQQQNVDTQMAKAEKANAEADLEAKQSLQQALATNMKDQEEYHQNYMNDLQNNLINPNHYLQNMSTEAKVGTAIGLFLGGWSQGLKGGSNPAMDYLNNQINRDIQAQVDNQGTRKSLLTANQAHFHDQVLAVNTTRMQMNDIYLDKMKRDAAALGTVQAQANYNKAAAAFKMQNAALLQQNALRMTVLHGMASGEVQQMDPVHQVRMQQVAGLMSPEDAKAATASIGKIDSIESLRKDVEDNARDLNQKALAGKLEPAYRASKIDHLAGILGKVAEGRFNLEEAKLQMGAMMPQPGDMGETRKSQAAARQQFFDGLRSEHEAPLRKYDINVPHLPLKDPREGQTGTLPNGQRVMMQNGQLIPIK